MSAMMDDGYETYSIDSRDFLIRPDTTDQLVVDEIWKQGIYKFLSPQPGDLILDIGGHIGIAAAWFAHHGAVVYTFEPIGVNFAMLERNIIADGAEVYPYNFPIMYQHGWFMFGKFPGRPNHHASYSMANNEAVPDMINCLSVSLKVLFEAPTIVNHTGPIKIKLDVEGAEYEHFLSGDTPWLDRVDKMIIEFHIYSEAMYDWYQQSIEHLQKHFTNVQHDLENEAIIHTLSYARCWNE